MVHTGQKAYTCGIRRVLEYGAPEWAPTATAVFSRLTKIQNEALQISTGAMRSMPILGMEIFTALCSPSKYKLAAPGREMILENRTLFEKCNIHQKED